MENGKGGTDLAFIKEIKRVKKWKVSLEVAKAIVAELKRTGFNGPALAKQFGFSVPYMSMLLAELQRAAEAGYTLEDYYAKGRPLSYSHVRRIPTPPETRTQKFVNRVAKIKK